MESQTEGDLPDLADLSAHGPGSVDVKKELGKGRRHYISFLKMYLKFIVGKFKKSSALFGQFSRFLGGYYMCCQKYAYFLIRHLQTGGRTPVADMLAKGCFFLFFF